MRYPAGLVFDSDGCGGEITKGTLVTNGRPGYLQFYDARKDRQRINVSDNQGSYMALSYAWDWQDQATVWCLARTPRVMQ